MKLQRELGFTEKLAGLINRIVPHNIIATAKISEYISVDKLPALERALVCLQSNQVLMRCKIISNKFYIHEDHGVSVTRVNKVDNWEKSAEDLLKQQLSDNELLFKLFLAQEEDGSDRLILMAQHSICDGKSIVLALLELLKIYDANLEEPQECSLKTVAFPQAMDAYLPEASEDDFEINERFSEENPAHEFMQDRMTGLCYSKFSYNETSKIIELSKTIGASINSLFSAAALITLRKNNTKTEKTLGFNTMVNMRKYLTTKIEDNQLGFYSSYIHNDVDINDLAFIDLARKIDLDTKLSLKNKLHITAAKYYKKLLSKKILPEELLDIIKVERPTFGISNIGHISVDFEYKNISVSDVSFCVSSHAYSRNENTFFVCLMTFNGEMTYLIHHPLPEFNRRRARSFSNSINQLLLNYSDSLISNENTADITKQHSSKVNPELKLSLL